MKYTYLNKLLSFIRVKQTMFNTNKISLLLILMFFTSNITIGQENLKIKYKKGYSSELVESFSSFQKDLLKREMILWTKHHELIKKSQSISKNFDLAEYDSLVSSGEQISSSLLTGALINL